MYSKNNAAQTPPMGWNSWDCYAATVDEEKLLGNAAYMAEHLREYGWEYIVCDIQWSDPAVGTGNGEYIPFTKLTLDEYGRQQPAPNRFPSGFAAIAGKIHRLGLKFGIHILRGVPRQAVHARLPVMGLPGVTCDQIADPFSICAWNSDMYGVRNCPEGQAYYDSLFQQYASWGVDYVKVDDICNVKATPDRPYSAKHEVEMIARAIEACGRPMVLSLSPGPALLETGWHMGKYANMWRMTDDFWDDWNRLKDMFVRCENWQTFVQKGCWPDCDMLPLGKIGMGWHQGRMTAFTHEEQRTMMTLWCIFRAPLMMGGEMRENDEWTLSLLQNSDVLHVLRYGGKPRHLLRSENEAIWTNTDEQGREYLAFFNLSDEEKVIDAPCDAWQKEPVRFRELWGRNEFVRDVYHASVPAHGTIILRNE